LARLITNAGGTVSLSGLTSTGMTAGSIEGAGNYRLGSKSLTVGGNNLSTEVSGAIQDNGGTGGSLVKVGTGTLTLSGINTYTGATTVNAGTLIVNGSIASSPVTVNAGATLAGIGTVGATTIMSGGTFAPGNSPGTMTVQGNLAFQWARSTSCR
jgi:autotransporter-associated beta strand protein